METLTLIYMILLGMILGSFIGLAAVRIPLGESIFAPRSHCRNCPHRLSWYDNIPILSYLVLRGKCRKCGVRISLHYFVAEVFTTAVVLLAFMMLHPWPRFLIYLVFFIIPLLLLFFLDWEALILPDVLTLPGIAVGFLVHWLDGKFFLPYQFDSTTLKLIRESLLGALAGSITLFIIALLYQRLKKREGLGGGDIKLAAMIGAFFGWKEVYFIFFLASVMGIFFGVVMILLKRGTRETPLPFGAFLTLTSLLFLFFGDFLLDSYLDLVRSLF